MPNRLWTPELTQRLKELYPTHPNWKVAELLGVKTSQVKAKSSVLKLLKADNYVCHIEGSPASKVDIDELRKFRHSNTDSDTMIKFNLSRSTLASLVRRHILTKDPELKKRAQFVKGQKSFNKGLKQEDYMDAEALKRVRKTYFKKGHIPANNREIGTISLRHSHSDRSDPPYYYIKVSNSEWHLLHRVLWEQHHGAIPNDKIIVFKDGDSLNVTIENLESISREDLMARNSCVYNLPDSIIATYLNGRNGTPEMKEELLNNPELLELKRNLIILQRQINNGLQK